MRRRIVVVVAGALSAVSFVAATDEPDAWPRGAHRRFDARKIAHTRRMLTDRNPFSPTREFCVLDGLRVLADSWNPRFRIEVDRAALQDLKTAEALVDRNNPWIGDALAASLAACGCEYAVLADGSVLVRRKPDAEGWTLERDDSGELPK